VAARSNAITGNGSCLPELLRAEPLIIETLRLEESRFLDTLARGLSILDEATRDLPQGGTLPGSVAFNSTTPMVFRSISRRTPCARARFMWTSKDLNRRWIASAPRHARPGPVPANWRPRPYGSPSRRKPEQPSFWAMTWSARKVSSPRSSRTVRKSRRLALARPAPSSSIRRLSMPNPAVRSATRCHAR